MCKPASMIISMNHKVHWHKDTDSHSEIRSLLNMPEEGIGRVRTVNIEISPPGMKLDTPLEEWVFKIDQREVPDWFNAAEAEAVVRCALADWADAKLFIAGRHKTLLDGQFYIGGSATIGRVGGSATIESVGGSATIESVGDSATIESVGGSATITTWQTNNTTMIIAACKSPNAVIIDRSVSPPVVQVGPKT